MPVADRLVAALAPRTPEVVDLVRRHIVALAAEVSDVELAEITEAAETPAGTGMPDLARRAGISERQADHWTRMGWLVPEDRAHDGHGYPRTYPGSEIVKARVMGALVRLFDMRASRASVVADEIIRSGAAKVGAYTITKRAVS